MPTSGVAGAALAPFGVFVPELVPGQLNTGGVGIYETDVEGDGNRFGFNQDFSQHKPEGIHGRRGALTRDRGSLTGTYKPQYELLSRRCRQVFGAPYETGTLADGRPYERFRLPERGRGPSIETDTYFYGVDDDAYEGRYGFVAAYGHTFARMGDVGGTLDVRVCRVDRGQAMPGTVNQTEVQRLLSTDAGGAVTVHHYIGAGGSFTVTPGDNAATVQTAARAQGMTGVVVAGTSTAASAGTEEVQTITCTALPAGPIYLSVTPPGGSPQTISVLAESATIAADLQTELEALFGAGLVAVTGGPLTASSGPAYAGVLTVTFDASLGNVAQISAAGGQTGVVGDTTTPGVQSSNGAVNLTFTYSGQANTNVGEITLSGTHAADYTASTVTQGSGLEDYYVASSPYVESDHILIYHATDLDDLNSIDMQNVPSDASAGDSHLILSAEGGSFNFGNLADYHYQEDRHRYPHAHVALEPTVGWTITLPKSSTGDCEEIFDTTDDCIAEEKFYRFAEACGDWEAWWDFYGSRSAAPGTPTANGVAQIDFAFERSYNLAAYNDDTTPWGSAVVTLVRPVDSVVP